MSITLQKLSRLARESARNRGHKLSRFCPSGPTTANAVCAVCEMEVNINAKPAPNEISIGGEAVALNCAIPRSTVHIPVRLF